MAKLKLTLAIGGYEVNRALIEGAVEADGIELKILHNMGSQEFAPRMIRARQFDVAENGFNYVIRCAPGGDIEGFTGLPIFPHRRFRYGFVFMNPTSGIKEPKDFIGKKVGCMYLPAGNVWARGLLSDHHGVKYRDVQWVGERMGLYHLNPKWHGLAEPGVRLQDMLVKNEIAGLICPDLPPLLIKRDPRIAQMFPNYRQNDLEFFKKTSIFPIMHAVMIRREITEKYPWVATELMKAFEASKRMAYKRLINPRIVPLAFYRSEWEEQEELMGPDPWEYGLGPRNRKTMETVMRYMVEQEMLTKAPKVEDLFAPYDIADATPDDWH
jgi:4,5-dihydroxyphthalate decarboxylase